MKKITFNKDDAGRYEWFEARRGRITGTRLHNIKDKRGGGRKKGFYELLAERIAIPPDDENRMDRGKRLEDEALERFSKETGKEVNTDLVMWVREDNEHIAVSPDGTIDAENASVEVKCLASEHHIEAYLTQDFPKSSKDYEMYKAQARQHFIVNDNLETHYVVFYDPRMPIDFFYITIKRDDVANEIAEELETELMVLAEIDRLEAELTF